MNAANIRIIFLIGKSNEFRVVYQFDCFARLAVLGGLCDPSGYFLYRKGSKV